MGRDPSLLTLLLLCAFLGLAPKTPQRVKWLAWGGVVVVGIVMVVTGVQGLVR